jgi:hypothetical protein
VDVSDELSGERRLKLLRELNEAARQAGFPNFDAEGLAAGHLAGPASTDRPPVPVWEYLDYVAKHPEVSIDEISQIRFPISFHGGGSTVTSIAEHTAPGPVPPTFSLTAEDIVRLFALMHDAGAMQWNAETRTIEELKPRASYAPAIYEKWRSQLDARGK